jgi:hypothetical protein
MLKTVSSLGGIAEIKWKLETGNSITPENAKVSPSF